MWSLFKSEENWKNYIFIRINKRNKISFLNDQKIWNAIQSEKVHWKIYVKQSLTSAVKIRIDILNFSDIWIKLKTWIAKINFSNNSSRPINTFPKSE